MRPPVTARPVCVPPAIIGGKKLAEHGEQVGVAARAELHDRESGSRMRDENVQETVAAAGGVAREFRTPAGDVRDRLAACGAEPERGRHHAGRSLFGSFATTAS